jgi:multiple sugar transport system ATP-binding protein
MNMLPATLRRSAAGAEVELADGTRLAAPAGSGGVDGQPVIFGTRPEHLALADSGIATEVAVVEPTGADTFVSCRHQGRELAAVFRERHAFTPGSTIRLQPDLQRAHLFDAGSGRRLAA